MGCLGPTRWPCNLPEWCNHHFSVYWRLAFWVQPIYAYRNEWAWGVDGGTRGLANFTEAVGLWAHCFCRMLEKSWARRTRLYRIACWEMIEYLYKWAIRVQPPPDPVPAIAVTPPAQAPQPADGEDEDEDSKSHHSDDSAATCGLVDTYSDRQFGPGRGDRLMHHQYGVQRSGCDEAHILMPTVHSRVRETDRFERRMLETINPVLRKKHRLDESFHKIDEEWEVIDS
jgi:hypothetical protein